MAGVSNVLGRVVMRHRGDYDPAFAYAPLDCCYHDGSTYFCKAATTGNAPPNTAYWVMMSTSASTVDREAAEAAAAAAEASKVAAANQVTLAADQVTLAEGQALIATTKAEAATTSATAAANSAGQAEAHKGDAELAAGEAAASATSAASSATAAATSAASVDGPGLYNAIATHDHSGDTGHGVQIDYANLAGSPPCPYGVGDILETDNSVSPAMRWPGTVWASMAPGRVLVGIDPNDTDFDTVGKQGGEKTHTLTIEEMPPHGHGPTQEYLITDQTTKTGKTTEGLGWYTPGAHIKIPVQGGGQPMNIMQPYETVYRYKRTA